MKQLLERLITDSKTLSIDQMIMHICMAVVIGLVIYISYWLSHSGTIYSKKFNVSLIMLTILTATVMAVIGNNVALSLGMVGALSIVRYRTAIKDSRDTAYIFWAIIGGICCGAGDYMIGAIGSAAVFLVLLVLGRMKNDTRLMLVVRGKLELEREIEQLVFSDFERKALLRVKNTTRDNIEMIYEVSRKQYERANSTPNSLINRIYALGEISYVNIVAQNDEII